MISAKCKVVYKNYQQIYTDGSKEDSKVSCAVIPDNHSNIQRIPDDSSIFTAEAKAIDLALDFISTCDANNKFIIFSDSLSVLKAMNHTSSKNPQIQKLLEKCHELLAYKEIVLCWIPSYTPVRSIFIPRYEVYRGYIVFAFSVIMFVCLSVCLSVNFFFRQRFLSNYLG